MKRTWSTSINEENMQSDTESDDCASQNTESFDAEFGLLFENIQEIKLLCQHIKEHLTHVSLKLGK